MERILDMVLCIGSVSSGSNVLVIDIILWLEELAEVGNVYLLILLLEKDNSIENPTYKTV